MTNDLSHLKDEGFIKLQFVDCPDSYLSVSGKDTVIFYPNGSCSKDTSCAIWNFDGTCPDLKNFNYWLKPFANSDIANEIAASNRLQYKLSVHHMNFVDGTNGILGKNPMLYVRYYNPWNLLTWDIPYKVRILD